MGEVVMVWIDGRIGVGLLRAVRQRTWVSLVGDWVLGEGAVAMVIVVRHRLVLDVLVWARVATG
jgi:hypothetical protein